MRYRGPGKRAKKGAIPLAPPEGDILGRMFLALVPENHPNCDLNYFRDKYFPARYVDCRVRGNFLIAAVVDWDVDDRPRRAIQVEASSPRVKSEGKLITRHVSVRQYASFVDPADIVILREQLNENGIVMTEGELRYRPTGIEYPCGGIYIIWDEYEKEPYYIGEAGDDPAARAEQHFHLDNDTKTPFDAYCNLSRQQMMRWKVYLIDAAWCDQIVRKSLFWDQSEYEEHMSRIEEEYRQKVEADPKWFRRKAECALITFYQPRFNVAGNALRPLKKRKRLST